MVLMVDSMDKGDIGDIADIVDIVDNRSMVKVGDIGIRIDTVLGKEVNKGNYYLDDHFVSVVEFGLFLFLGSYLYSLVLCFAFFFHNNYSILPL